MAVIFLIATVFFILVVIEVERENGGFSSKRDDDKGKWIVIFEDGVIETYDSYKEANDRYNSCEAAQHLGTIK